MTARRSATETEIPPHLFPTVIARQIKLHDGVVYRISVKRNCGHHFNITVRTKSLNREFRARQFADNPVEDLNSNGDYGGAP